jgi:hypothetical protein
MLTKQVSRSMDRSGSPIVAAEAEQVEQLEEDLLTGPIRGFCALHVRHLLEPRLSFLNRRLRTARVGS